MSRTTETLTPDLHEYLLRHNRPQPDALLRDLVTDTAGALADDAEMQIAPEQGAFMTLLTRLLGVEFAVEVGTFTGYSSVCIARGLAPGGRLLCCDVSEEFTAIAQRYWKRAGLSDRIELRLAPALDTLRALPGDPRVDLAFIDADKGGYVDYWEELVPRMRPGGVVLVDNVFADGRVAGDDARTSENVAAIRRFNDHAAADDRVELAMLPIADGLTFARKV
ncbi:MAG: SAM-dependent methyltransferase [Propionibacteriales bacterium]|nr:SAM-dependent methyltransferase [Propionibacteriales bacterium]